MFHTSSKYTLPNFYNFLGKTTVYQLFFKHFIQQQAGGILKASENGVPSDEPFSWVRFLCLRNWKSISWLYLLSFCIFCSKLWLFFLNVNTKINVLFCPQFQSIIYTNTSWLKAVFYYINGSKFLRFLIMVVYFFCWNLFWGSRSISKNYTPQNKSATRHFSRNASFKTMFRGSFLKC